MANCSVLLWVCRSCEKHPCILLYNDIVKGDQIEFCVSDGVTITQDWQLEEHEDMLVSNILNHYLPRPVKKDD